MITKENIETAKKIYSQLEKWNFANNTLTEFFDKNRLNNSKKIILIKVVLIDGLYKTNLKDQISVAESISKINLLDELLKKGDINVVDKVAKWNNKNLISFASKFCHFHNKKTYPIYDNYVCMALKTLMNWKIKRVYREFKECIDKFKSENKIEEVSFEELDKYLWLFGLRERLRKGKTDINREIYNFYKQNEEMFNLL